MVRYLLKSAHCDVLQIIMVYSKLEAQPPVLVSTPLRLNPYGVTTFFNN